MTEAVEEGLNFRFRVGTSYLAEFALSHAPADVLRELVQNEYDAGGSELVIEFGCEKLVVRGNGQVIDHRGWKRLSVMLGTGHVAGEAGRVQAKVNGIGSKNFGLRSLFLFGDRIYVTSGGRRTILDLTQGALDKPLPDPPSAASPGVVITVPYRQVAEAPLQAFDEAYERQALRTIAAELAPTLIKLTQPGAAKNLRSVVVRSVRLGEELRWRQTARAVPGTPGLVRRTVRVEPSGDFLGDVPMAMSEIEHQAVLTPPSTLPKRDLPRYFKVGGGRVRIGISFRLKRDRLDLSASGQLYYPLGAGGSRTGFPFSICAPFEMTEDRSNIVDPQNSCWNTWLLEEAARFAIRLLPERLFDAYGADAYIGLDPRSAGATTTPLLREKIRQLLSVVPCWPTLARRRGGRPVLATAGVVVIPDAPALEEFVVREIPLGEVLDGRLVGHGAVRALAAESGAKTFSTGSLIRLRCAGGDSTELATKLDPSSEVVRSYSDFPAALQDLAVQHRVAAALDACRSSLKDAHKTDLRRSPTTMTAAGSLAAPAAPLWTVDKVLAGIAPPERTLHPALARYKVLADLCRPFNASNWAIHVSKSISDGAASTEEREALMAYLRGQPSLSEKAWAAVRRAPVLVDRSGDAAAPADMVISSARGASLLAPALHLPLPADEANESLRRLKFRDKVRGADLVALATLVEQKSEPASSIRRALSGLPELLTRTVVAQLKNVRFLETGSGSLLAPTDVYIRSEHLVAVLGEDAPYAIDVPVSQLAKLGCRSDPTADDVVAALVKLRDAGRHPNRPGIVSRALVDALRRERRSMEQFCRERILWTGAKWEAPVDCLVGQEHRKMFLDAVTILPEAQRDMWIALGASTVPTASQWRRLLMQISERYGSNGPVPPRFVNILRRAYRQLDGPPEGLPTGTYYLLDDHGVLHAATDALAGRVVINDRPALALAAVAAQAQVAFADMVEPQAALFFVATGTRHLSEVAVDLGTECGTELPLDGSLHADATLKRLHDPAFASAVVALVSTMSDAGRATTATMLVERLTRVERIVVVDGIARRYQVAGTTVSVQDDYLLLDDQLVVRQVPGSFELRRVFADAVAEMVDNSPVAGQLLGDTIFFLLRARSVAQMQRELQRRNVVWQPDAEPGPEDTREIEDDEHDDSTLLAGAIGRTIVNSALGDSGTLDVAASKGSLTGEGRTHRPPLPELSEIHPRPCGRQVAALKSSPNRRSVASPGGWTPQSQDNAEEDRAIGRRGEEIVLGLERERVEKSGFCPDRVVWTAEEQPFADHDINSVDDDGEELWIEVKSTTGRDGRYSWPAAEFRLAVRARRRYVLYRVYEAATTTPSWVCVRDPISQFESGGLRLDLERLVGDVGPLATEDVDRLESGDP